MIEVRHFRSLVAIAESGKLATAAERVHVSQSALSHQIKAIEAHYGMPLFDRTRQGLRFTPAGERLLALAREALAAISAAERDLLRLKGDTRGELRVVLECHTCFDWLMPVMDEFRRRWPEVEIDLVAGFHADPLALLANGKADMVIGSKPPAKRGLEVAPLFRFEILAVIANEHRLRNKRRLEAADLAGETLITYPVPEQRIDLIREVLAPAGIHLQRRTAELTVAVLAARGQPARGGRAAELGREELRRSRLRAGQAHRRQGPVERVVRDRAGRDGRPALCGGLRHHRARHLRGGTRRHRIAGAGLTA